MLNDFELICRYPVVMGQLKVVVVLCRASFNHIEIVALMFVYTVDDSILNPFNPDALLPD